MGSVTNAAFESRAPQSLSSPLSCFSMSDVAFAASTSKLDTVLQDVKQHYPTRHHDKTRDMACRLLLLRSSFMSKPLRILEKQLVAMIGRIAVYGGNIHYAIFQFFFELTGIPGALAKTIFSNLRSDATQLEITQGAAKYVLSAELFDRVKAVFKQIGSMLAKEISRYM